MLAFLLPIVRKVSLAASGDPHVPKEEGPHSVSAGPCRDPGLALLSSPFFSFKTWFYLRINRMREK